MIQRTAIWILATLAFCSPGTVVTQQTRVPIGAGYEVWSVQIASDGVSQTVSRLTYKPTANPVEPVLIFQEPGSKSARQLFFGSLYNRPPPVSLSFS